MSHFILATFENGTFVPDVPVPLPAQSRVRLTVETLAEACPNVASAAQEAWARMKCRIAERPVISNGRRWTRDELHERD